jgi:hypothetical protein
MNKEEIESFSIKLNVIFFFFLCNTLKKQKNNSIKTSLSFAFFSQQIFNKFHFYLIEKNQEK